MSPPPRPVRERPQPDQGILLPVAQGRVLHFPQHQADGLVLEEAGGRAAGRCGSCGAVRNRIRRIWRGPSAVQYRQFDRASSASAGSHRSVDEEAFVGLKRLGYGPAAQRAFFVVALRTESTSRIRKNSRLAFESVPGSGTKEDSPALQRWVGE